MKVEITECATPTCKGCGRRVGLEHYPDCPKLPENRIEVGWRYRGTDSI